MFPYAAEAFFLFLFLSCWQFLTATISMHQIKLRMKDVIMRRSNLPEAELNLYIIAQNYATHTHINIYECVLNLLYAQGLFVSSLWCNGYGSCVFHSGNFVAPPSKQLFGVKGIIKQLASAVFVKDSLLIAIYGGAVPILGLLLNVKEDESCQHKYAERTM